jgi:hypothetical protein
VTDALFARLAGPGGLDSGWEELLRPLAGPYYAPPPPRWRGLIDNLHRILNSAMDAGVVRPPRTPVERAGHVAARVRSGEPRLTDVTVVPPEQGSAAPPVLALEATYVGAGGPLPFRAWVLCLPEDRYFVRAGDHV